uniref:Uncharacterized protein n=1 Tax=Pseudo-nitzschia australis TaxID=44445 RepID=A0A7S4AXQ7_9STRA
MLLRTVIHTTETAIPSTHVAILLNHVFMPNESYCINAPTFSLSSNMFQCISILCECKPISSPSPRKYNAIKSHHFTLLPRRTPRQNITSGCHVNDILPNQRMNLISSFCKKWIAHLVCLDRMWHV